MKLDFEEYSNPEIENAIDTWIHGKINREMLKSKLIDHETIERIAEKYGYSPFAGSDKEGGSKDGTHRNGDRM